MSDFLGRLAARHAESATPAITPRAVSRFEAPPLHEGHDVAEASAPVESKPLPARALETPTPLTPQRAAPAVDKPFSQSVVAETSELTPVARSVPTRTRVEQILKEVERIVSSPPLAEPRAEVVRGQQIAASPVVPRVIQPQEVRQASQVRATTKHVSADESEPTVIRVHIGRIDVRATAPAPDRTRPRAKSDAAKPMSLDRYLSGKDRA
jgi:hypothetical protein